MTAQHAAPRPPRRRRRAGLAAGLAVGLTVVGLVAGAPPAPALSYTQIAGGGSSWAGDAWKDWTSQAGAQGVVVNYNPVGSSMGRTKFAQQIDFAFADSEIPYTGDASDSQDNTVPGFGYGMLPIVAGGTAFMYNLPVGGTRFTSLRLSMSDIAGIFSGRIATWNDPALATSNPGVALPNHQIITVVRSDGSGATAQFKLWMLRQFPDDYKLLVQHTGGDPTKASSYYPTGDYGTCSSPTQPCFSAQNGSAGVTTFTKNTEYTIDYDEYAYALGAGFPVAQVKNAAGFYTVPTASAVAVALLKTKINTNPADPNYLSQDLSEVYTYGDPRTYPMSMYSYELVPKQTTNAMSTAAGATLAWLSHNAVCEWQRDMGPLGYSPLPMNLVLASLDQIKQIPGIDADTTSEITATVQGVLHGGTDPCNNPTFKAGDDPAHNVLVDTAPFPSGCDAACQGPWKQAGTGPSTGNGTGTGTGTKTGTSTGTGTTGNGGTGTTASTAPGTSDVATAAPSCDPDTGLCSGASAVLAAGSNVRAVAATIPGDPGWTTTHTLGLLAGLLVLLVVLVAPVADRVLRRRDGGRR